MSYFTRNLVKDSKPHVYIDDFSDGGRRSGRSFEKRQNRRFVRRAGKKMIDNDG
jgi:hypothetical protein